MDSFDPVVVGGGAAGLGAARHAVQRGAKTLLVNDGEPGGDCTFTGWVPSKTLIESAKAATRIRPRCGGCATSSPRSRQRRTQQR